MKIYNPLDESNDIVAKKDLEGLVFSEGRLQTHMVNENLLPYVSKYGNGGKIRVVVPNSVNKVNFPNDYTRVFTLELDFAFKITAIYDDNTEVSVTNNNNKLSYFVMGVNNARQLGSSLSAYSFTLDTTGWVRVNRREEMTLEMLTGMELFLKPKKTFTTPTAPVAQVLRVTLSPDVFTNGTPQIVDVPYRISTELPKQVKIEMVSFKGTLVSVSDYILKKF